VLGSSAAGLGERTVIDGSANKPAPVSNWKAAAQREGLR